VLDAAGPRLRLASGGGAAADDDGAPRRFAFDLTAEGDGFGPLTFSVERDGDAVALLARGPTGLPYLYATDRFLAKIDSGRPDRLVVVTGTSFGLSWTGEPKPAAGAGSTSSWRTRAAVDLDVPALLRAALAEATTVRAAGDETVTIETDRATSRWPGPGPGRGSARTRSAGSGSTCARAGG
jgi:hypothetical protein